MAAVYTGVATISSDCAMHHSESLYIVIRSQRIEDDSFAEDVDDS
jgi:hypothetical protein